METSKTTQASWEYLMPKKKERIAGYIRFSDPSTPLDSSELESQAKAIREYAEKEGYLYDISKHEYREAISAYTVPYMERKILLTVLDAAKRREFDVLVTTEVRSISRRTVEVFVIYDMLQKYGVRYETIQEKFEDSATGHLILSARAFSAEVERENTYARLQRGKRHRLEISKAPNGHSKPAYGYVFIDTIREAKAAYIINPAIVYIDTDGEKWTEARVITWMASRCLEGWSCNKIALTLTEWGVPTPLHTRTIHGKPVSQVWHGSTIYNILTHRMYIGEVYANRFRREENPRTKKPWMVIRPQEEWIPLENVAPPILSREVFEKVQEQLAVNKQEAMRRNKPDIPKEDLGLLRAGYAKCGICGYTMSALRRKGMSNGQKKQPQYTCCRRLGGGSALHNHHTIIGIPVLDREVKDKIREVVLDPSQVREQVALHRAKSPPVIDVENIAETMNNIQTEINNLFDLARHASTDSTRERLGLLLEELEQRKREAESLLFDLDDGEEEQALLEAELIKFEEWVENVRPYLGDTTYLEQASYEELRLAVRIIGITAIVYPLHGDYPFRVKLESRPPVIMQRMADCIHID